MESTAASSTTATNRKPLDDTSIPLNMLSGSRPEAASIFQTSFTKREAELQKLLAQERQRSEQRQANYNLLKEQHLKLQNEFLGLQAEMKQTLEETMYFKEKKNNELNELLSSVEEKSKHIDRLQKELREKDPEVIRLKCAAEFEEPLRRLQKDNDRLEKEKEKALYDARSIKQQLEHLEREQIDSIEKVRLSYEAELNLIKREKDEIRARLVEASQVPDVKRLIEMSEENARLSQKLHSAQSALEQADQQYKQIHTKVEMFVHEQEQREKLHENEVHSLHDQLQLQKMEMKKLRNELATKKSENDEVLCEIDRLQRIERKLKLDIEQCISRCNHEKEEIRRTMTMEKNSLMQELATLNDEIKRLKVELENRDEKVIALEKELHSQNKEFNDKLALAKAGWLDKMCTIEQKKKSLEIGIKELTGEKQTLKTKLEKLRRQNEQQNESKLTLEREIMVLRAKLEAQMNTIEELEKVRRQHLALHEELDRVRAENFELSTSNKQMMRTMQGLQEDLTRVKESFDQQRHETEEATRCHNREMSKQSRRFDEERHELQERITVLERDNAKMRHELKLGCDHHHSTEHTSRSQSMRTKQQYTKMAAQLNSILEQLQTSDNKKKNVTSIRDKLPNGTIATAITRPKVKQQQQPIERLANGFGETNNDTVGASGRNDK